MKKIAIVIIFIAITGCTMGEGAYQLRDPEIVKKIQDGMRKNEVISILGKPQDTNGPDRWTYRYRGDTLESIMFSSEGEGYWLDIVFQNSRVIGGNFSGSGKKSVDDELSGAYGENKNGY